jgi:UDP-N-acetylmuramate dehydrogenase
MEISENVSLKSYNTFGINAAAKYFAPFNSVDGLQELLSRYHQQAGSSLLVLGGGSNILLTKDFDGLVLKNEIAGIEVVDDDADHVYVRAGAGENWHQFVQYCVQNEFAGVENLSLIPGNVGASPMQNIGAYGVELKDVFHKLDAWHINDQRLVSFSMQECAFGYRESVFKNRYKGQFIITSVTYRLNKKPVFNTSYGAIQQELEKMGVTELSIADISKAVINIRSSKLPNPKEIGNAGSFFKNPTVSKTEFQRLIQAFPNMPSFAVDDEHVKLSAAWLIEQCGWKGYRNGDAGCYLKQALVLVNYGNARGLEILELSEEIISSVQSKFDILLQREVNVI